MSAGVTSNGMPSWSRIALRCGERDASTSGRPSSGNHSPISRSAVLSESEPCTRLNVTSSAKSPRIDPGTASIGLVAPIRDRAAGHRVLPLQHHRDQRPARDELDQVGEERLARVLAVVLLGELAVDLHQLQRRDAQALALEARDDLAGQAALERVRLHEDQGPATCGAGGYRFGRLGGDCDVGSRAGASAGRSPLFVSGPSAPRSAVAAGRARLAIALLALAPPTPRCAPAVRAFLLTARAPWRARPLPRGSRPPPPRSRGTRATAGRAACRSCARLLQLAHAGRAAQEASGSTSPPQLRQVRFSSSARRFSAALISSSRSWRSSRYSGGRTIV